MPTGDDRGYVFFGGPFAAPLSAEDHAAAAAFAEMLRAQGYGVGSRQSDCFEDYFEVESAAGDRHVPVVPGIPPAEQIERIFADDPLAYHVSRISGETGALVSTATLAGGTTRHPEIEWRLFGREPIAHDMPVCVSIPDLERPGTTVWERLLGDDFEDGSKNG